MESSNFNFSSLVELIRANIKVFIIVAIIAAIAGVVISMPTFMPPLYKSVAVVYPQSFNTYSDESETEQLLQYFEANSVRDSIVEKFDLFRRYEIDPDSENARFYLLREFNDHVVVSKTRYESVRLEVTDRDPEVAKAIADEMLYQTNLKINLLINDWGMEMANSLENSMQYQRSAMDSIEGLISQISIENNLLDYEAQSRELVRGYIDLASRSGNSEAVKNLEGWMGRAQEKGSVVRMLQNLNTYAAEEYGAVVRGHLYWRERGVRNMNYLSNIVTPEVSDKKVWPVRWIILVVSVLSSLALTVVILALGKSFNKR